MEKHKYILTGKKFILITNHKAMEEMKRKKDFGSARVQRWFERLEKFNFEVVFRKGTLNVVSDALSRALKTSRRGRKVLKVRKLKMVIRKE
jgi:hypothetical protein